MEIVCKCGYRGEEIVEYITVKPTKSLVNFFYNYRTHVKTLSKGNETLNWACPSCSRVIVQQRGGLGYGNEGIEDMYKRLRTNSFFNNRYLRNKEKQEVK